MLLDEYARRAVDDDGSSFELGGRVTFMPIIRRKMQHRFEKGELCDTLAAESRALATWIKTKVTSHQTPEPTSISNALREDYRQLPKDELTQEQWLAKHGRPRDDASRDDDTD